MSMTHQTSASSLSEIARACDMPLSKAHKYLASFMHAGLVVQAGRSGKYDLGPQSVELGLAALARHDFVNSAAEELPELCAQTGLTGLLTVWGNQGATVVRWERTAIPIVTSMGLGTTLPLLHSASGRAFLAWAPPAAIQSMLDSELQRARTNPNIAPDITPTKAGVQALREKTLADGYASVDGKFIPGLVALAAPILDWQNQAQAVITLVSSKPDDVHPHAEPVQQLKDFTKRLSLAYGNKE